MFLSPSSAFPTKSGILCHNRFLQLCVFDFFSDLNDKPVFTNIPITIPVLESTPSGSKVFQVSQYDGEGDTPTFSATYLPVACSTLFSVAAAGIFISIE